jgi:hypothetical protein
MNVALQIAEIAGTDRRDLSKLEALDEPERLSALRTTVADMLPDRVPFSEERTSVLQVRTQVLNDDLADAFHRWYPGLMPAMDEQPLTA